ncbi:MAG TPA: hypothetical protein VGQ96_07060, partial [Candidatus Eremiobacteraceae bacterium]|nr:hypothetical protein [Candidatus Eremiobacteraceae bacterium]
LPIMDTHVVVDTNGHSAANAAHTQASADAAVPLSLLFAIAGVVAAIFAGIYGGSLSEENDGHLALAWTKPVSRTRYALGIMSVDLAFVAFVFAFTVVVVTDIIYQHGGLHFVTVDRDAWFNLARFTLMVAAWFGLAQALTASLRRHSGTVRGVSVAIAAILLGLASAGLPPLWHAAVAFLNYFNPIAYAAYSYPQPQPLYPFATWGLDLAALAAIATLGVALALAQWRRLEA